MKSRSRAPTISRVRCGSPAAGLEVSPDAAEPLALWGAYDGERLAGVVSLDEEARPAGDRLDRRRRGGPRPRTSGGACSPPSRRRRGGAASCTLWATARAPGFFLAMGYELATDGEERSCCSPAAATARSTARHAGRRPSARRLGGPGGDLAALMPRRLARMSCPAPSAGRPAALASGQTPAPHGYLGAAREEGVAAVDELARVRIVLGEPRLPPAARGPLRQPGGRRAPFWRRWSTRWCSRPSRRAPCAGSPSPPCSRCCRSPCWSRWPGSSWTAIPAARSWSCCRCAGRGGRPGAAGRRRRRRHVRRHADRVLDEPAVHGHRRGRGPSRGGHRQTRPGTRPARRGGRRQLLFTANMVAAVVGTIALFGGVLAGGLVAGAGGTGRGHRLHRRGVGRHRAARLTPLQRRFRRSGTSVASFGGQLLRAVADLGDGFRRIGRTPAALAPILTVAAGQFLQVLVIAAALVVIRQDLGGGVITFSGLVAAGGVGVFLGFATAGAVRSRLPSSAADRRGVRARGGRPAAGRHSSRSTPSP